MSKNRLDLLRQIESEFSGGRPFALVSFYDRVTSVYTEIEWFATEHDAMISTSEKEPTDFLISIPVRREIWDAREIFAPTEDD